MTEAAVVDGIVYVGGNDGSLYAITAKSGKPVWRYETDGRVYVGPAIADGLAYITTDSGILSAIDIKDGSERWRVTLSSQSWYITNTIIPTVAVANGTVYIGGMGILLAFDASNGHQSWALETDGSAMSSPSIAAGTLYSVSLDGRLYSVEAETGLQLWSYGTPAEGPFGADGSPLWLPAPAIANGTVYFTNVHGRIYAVTGS